MANSRSRDFIDMHYFGRQIAKFRKERHLSQWQVAKSADISQSVLGKIESGHSMPMLSTAVAIADFFEVDLLELIKQSAPKKEDMRSFYAKYSIFDCLPPEQSQLFILLAKNIVLTNKGMKHVG